MICIIPARQGSKRIHDKNIKDLHGIPMLKRAIDTAKKTGMFSRVIVSSDSDHYRTLANDWGAEAIDRPSRLAVDDPDVGTVDVVSYHTKELDVGPVEDKLICALYPCSPMVRPHHIEAALDDFLYGRDPYLYVANWKDNTDQGQFYWGTFTVWNRGYPINHKECTVFRINSVFDINTPEDWERAEKLYEEAYL